jgi:hypothetical protein
LHHDLVRRFWQARPKTQRQTTHRATRPESDSAGTLFSVSIIADDQCILRCRTRFSNLTRLIKTIPKSSLLNSGLIPWTRALFAGVQTHSR